MRSCGAAGSGYDPPVDESPQSPAAAPRPSTPQTAEQLRLSLKVLRIGFMTSIVAIALMTWIFIAYMDAPEVPLIPVAALVIVVDVVMLVAFTRQRKQAIAELEEGRAGLPG